MNYSAQPTLNQIPLLLYNIVITSCMNIENKVGLSLTYDTLIDIAMQLNFCENDLQFQI